MEKTDATAPEEQRNTPHATSHRHNDRMQLLVVLSVTIGRTLISLGALALGGYALREGSQLLLAGDALGKGSAFLKIFGLEFTASTLGAIVMMIAPLSMFFAYLCRPTLRVTEGRPGLLRGRSERQGEGHQEEGWQRAFPLKQAA